MRFALALAMLFTVGCSRGTPSSAEGGAKGQPAAAKDDCTLETPLVPGVPGSPGHLIPSDVNPNGASELAALMRAMQKDLAQAREAIAGGASLVPLHERHRKMRCAWPTAAEDRNPTFDAMAQAYLVQVKAFDARKDDPRALHDRVLDGCVACHEQSCAGPIPAIQALRLSAAQP